MFSFRGKEYFPQGKEDCAGKYEFVKIYVKKNKKNNVRGVIHVN